MFSIMEFNFFTCNTTPLKKKKKVNLKIITMQTDLLILKLLHIFNLQRKLKIT